MDKRDNKSKMVNSSGTKHRHKKNLSKMSRDEKRVEFTKQNKKRTKKIRSPSKIEVGLKVVEVNEVGGSN